MKVLVQKNKTRGKPPPGTLSACCWVLDYASDTFCSYINTKVKHEQFGGGNLCQ